MRYFVWDRLTTDATKAETGQKIYAFAALQNLVLVALGVALLQVGDGRSGCGNYECDDSEDILGMHLEFVLD